MRKTLSLTVLAAVSLGFAPAPFPKPDSLDPSKDLKKLQGTWLRVSCSQGVYPPAPKPINDLVVFTGNRITYQSASITWFVTLGVEKGKRTFDISKTEGVLSPDAWIGLYELKGDTLKICFVPSRERPKNIEPGKAGEYLQVFQRQKP